MGYSKSSLSRKKSSSSRKKSSSKKKYRGHPLIQFKLISYNFSSTSKISKEVADECTQIEKMGGEVLNIMYNTYLPWHARKNSATGASNKADTFLGMLVKGAINSALNSEKTAVYIFYSLNRVNIDKPRKFYYLIDRANFITPNNVVGNIGVNHFNRFLFNDYTHICTLMDTYTQMRGLGNSQGDETTFIITFYAK